MQTVHAQYLLFTCTGLTHYWTMGYMLHRFQVEHVEDGRLRLLLVSVEKKRKIFLQTEGFSVFKNNSTKTKTIPEQERLQICPCKCVIATCLFSTPPPPPHKHPLILPFHSWINPPLHHPLILRPSTYVAHEKWGGDGSEDEWNREWRMKGSGGRRGREE